MKGSSLASGGAPVRGMIVGYPKGGKTPALASLLNVGYKVRLINLEGLNWKSLVEYTDPRALDNLDVITLADTYQMNTVSKMMEPMGDPKVFNRILELMKDWTDKDENGKPYSLGKSTEWGPDTVVVLDSLTAQAEASIRRIQKLLNRPIGQLEIRDWGFVVNDQMEMLRLMTRADRRYHFLITAHLTLISPPMINPKEDETNKEIKRSIGDLISPRIYPKAATQNLSTFIAKEFPMIIQAKQDEQGKRYLHTRNGEGIDLACPVKNAKPKYDLSTGLAEIFEAWGHKAPGFGKKGK